MSYQNYINQALYDVYRKRQQKLEKQQYNYGGYAGERNSYLAENNAQPSPISQAIQQGWQPQTSYSGTPNAFQTPLINEVMHGTSLGQQVSDFWFSGGAPNNAIPNWYRELIGLPLSEVK